MNQKPEPAVELLEIGDLKPEVVEIDPFKTEDLTEIELRFLLEYANTGQVEESARAVGLTRQKVYRLRMKKRAFGLAYQESSLISVCSLEDEANKLAKKGEVRLIMWLLSRLEPAKYGNKVEINFTQLTNDQLLHVYSLTTRGNGQP